MTAVVRARSTDAEGRVWASSATFRADPHGAIDLDRARALSGSYTGVWGMGLVASMSPPKPAPGSTAYVWSPSTAHTFTISVHVHGKRAASASVRRAAAGHPVDVQSASLATEGFFGRYFAPADVTARGPAILVVGGSEGGLVSGFLAYVLASHGYPTLAPAYFKEPGLPQTLSNIPLEYFAGALTWLRRRPQVDPRRIVVLGVSRGSEAALLLAVHYPDLVHAVIASVPSNVAICSYPGCSGPAWTLGGQPLPYTRQFNDPNPSDDPRAMIAVEQIRGPVVLDCGGVDQVWDSCGYATAIISRLDTHHDPYTHLLYAYPRAGHRVGVLLPYEPAAIARAPTVVPDERAREQLWPHLLSFLARLRASG